MIQAYSDNIGVAANSPIPFNNVVYAKGGTSSLVAPASIALYKRGVYLVELCGYGSVVDAGDFGVQLYVNGVPRLDAISKTTVAVGDLGAVSTKAIVVVQESDCPCNCTAAPTIVQAWNPSDVASATAHYNILVTKLC